jgi:hypothetical protein
MRKWIVVSLFVAAMFCGCAATPQRVVYNTLSNIKDTVNGAKQLYAIAYVDGKVPAQTHVRVLTIETNYNVAFRAAVIAARFDYSQAAPTNVIRLSSDLINTISEVVK